MGGFKLFDRLKAAGEAIPTVCITAQDNAATRARRAGATAYPGKPFDARLFLEVVSAALQCYPPDDAGG
jgi:FixJ family two-component response regulator